MPSFLGSLFTCNNTDKIETENVINNLRERVNNLEQQMIGLKDILVEIRTDIKLIQLSVQQKK